MLERVLWDLKMMLGDMSEWRTKKIQGGGTDLPWMISWIIMTPMNNNCLNLIFMWSCSKKKSFAFYIFFSNSHILWNIVANIKKKITCQKWTRFFLTEKNQVYWVIMWLCRSIFIAWKNMANFCRLKLIFDRKRQLNW